MKQLLTILICVAALSHPAAAAGPKVHIVVGEKAEAIEKFAAEEMAGQLKKLFEADVAIVAAAPSDAANIIHLGTQKSSPLAAKLGDAWPKLSDQGHALSSLEVDGKKVLLVAGGSPRAVLWAAYELGWQHGIRYFLFGDLYPIASPDFSLTGFNVVLDTTDGGRGMLITGASPLGPETWGLEEHRRILGQMAKLKSTYYRLDVHAFGYPQLAKTRLRVDGDTAGRAVFGGAKFFDNADLAAASETERKERTTRLIRDVADAAQRLGIEFTNATPLAGTLPQKPLLATQTALPRISFSTRAAGILAGRAHSEMMNKFLATLEPDLRAEMYRSDPWLQGRVISIFATDANPGDVAFEYVVMARGSFVAQPPADLLEEYLGPVCGEGVAERVLRAFDHCEQAVRVLDRNEFNFAAPKEDMLVRFYGGEAPPPAWWGEVRTHYLNAMNEMYRANTRAREGGRAFTLYYARRFEFAFEYMNAVEALRKAAIAKKAGDKDAQIAELEKALDSITNACNAMAAVARSNSDRGIIAVMNEYGYRPVTKLLEEADAN